MRFVFPCVGLVGLSLLAGCNLLRPGSVRPDNSGVTRTTPSAAQLVQYLDDNAQKVQSLRCDELELTVARGLGIVQSMRLPATIACQRPRSFRLQARNPAGMDEVDLGSNDQEFWFWIKRNDPPYQFYCPYQALDEGRRVRLPFPFQPEWVMEALGMGNYGPADKYQVVEEGNRWKLVQRNIISPQGTRVRKVIVFNKQLQKDSSPQVTDFLLIDDEKNKEICSAHITEVQRSADGSVVPRRMELRWPEQGARLTLLFSGAARNPQLPPTVFVRGRMPGVPAYNMATNKLDGQASSLERVRGYSSR
jgi:hypothetical protein